MGVGTRFENDTVTGEVAVFYTLLDDAIVRMPDGGWNVNENVTFTRGLENLTDEDYRVHGSGVNEPGINAIFGARVGW